MSFYTMLEQLSFGMLRSMGIFFLTLLFSLPLGLMISFGRMSKNKIVSGITGIIISVLRGTPLMLQLLVVYFFPFFLFGLSISNWRFPAIIVGFSINYAAYFAEIYRSGLQAIDKGQYEASRVLGFNKIYTFFHIILPQVFKIILPALAGEVITLVKDTALAQTIGVAELFRAAQNAASREFSTMPIFIAGVFFFVMNYLVSKFFNIVEDKMNYYD